MSEPFHPPLELADLPPGHRLYLLACPTMSDSSMVWGTEAEVGPLREEVSRRNREADLFLTPVHFFVKAVERALSDHPEVNRRILRGRIRPYVGHHLFLSTQVRDGSASLVYLPNVQEMCVEEIGRMVWTRLLEERVTSGREGVLARRRYPILRILGPRISGVLFRTVLSWMDRRASERYGQALGVGAPVLVNYLGGRGMPPMRSFHPSRLPLGFALTSVTFGTSERRPVANERGVEARWMVPVHVRSDHRLVDGIELGRFTATIKEYVEHPERLTR